MPNLFGLDIAKIVNSSIASAGNVRPGVLNHNGQPTTRDPLNPSGGLQPTVTIHTFRGFVEQKEIRRRDSVLGSQQVGASYGAMVSILGESVNPKVIPEVNDSVEIDGVSYLLTELVSRDPASALYTFKADV